MTLRAPRRWTAATVTVLCLAALIPAGPARAGGAAPGIAWVPCEQNPAVQCGTVRVPVDWTNPRGPAIDLAVARRPAQDPAARIGSLVTGYPLNSGVDFLLDDVAETAFSAELRRRFDIVSWDPRGVGRSNPIRCSTALRDQMALVELGRIPANQAEFDRDRALSRRLLADCRAHTGPVFDHVDIASSARDLDAIRAGLGDPGLTFVGGSYGALLGQQYAEQFPHRIRALVLDSNPDHSLDIRGWWRIQSMAVQDSFDEFVRWSDRTPASALHGRDVRAVWHRLLGRASVGDLPSPEDPTQPATAAELIFLAYGAFHGPAWAGLAQTLASLDTAGAPAEPPTPQRATPPTSDTVAYPISMWCNDWRLPVRDHAELAGLLRDAAERTPDMRYPPEAPVQTLMCLGATDPIPNPQHPLRVRDASTPVLLVQALHDPNTGYLMGTNVADQLGRNGVLLTYDGWGHVLYRARPARGSACVDDTIDRYLLTQKLPPRGSHCPAAEPATAS